MIGSIVQLLRRVSARRAETPSAPPAAGAVPSMADTAYRHLLAATTDGVLGVDAAGRIDSINPAAELIFGVQAAEVIGQPVAQWLPDLDALAAGAAGQRQAITGRRHDGAAVPLTVATVAADHPAGRCLLLTDLGNRPLAEHAPDEAQRRLDALIEAAPFPIITTDVSGIVDAMNPAAERLTLYSRQELVGSALTLIQDPDEARRKAAELGKASGQPVEPGFATYIHHARRGLSDEGEWTFVRKDSTRVPVHLAVNPLRGPDGEIRGYMAIAFDISERHRREEHSRHVANHDQLTGLPMRNLLNDRLAVAIARAKRERSRIGVMMLDLDHFKRVNDSLGHHVGDDLLRTVAQRLVAALRGSDTVARMGGDEFVILVPDVAEVAHVERVAAHIIAQVGKPLMLGSHHLAVTPSIGIAMYPDDGESAQELLKNADSAMYNAKDGGRYGYRLFSRDMERAVSMKLELESDLRRAMERGLLRLHYQPIVNLSSGEITGMEALLRWKDPTRGDVSPSVFVAAAEESGLILPLGEWVLRTACREAKLIQQRTGRPLRIAVNLSPRQFAQANLIDTITAALRDAELAASNLEIEITEGVLMDNTEFALERLQQLRALGVTIAIDDFGTGFSSLAYITRFPIDTMKIDRSFVAKVCDSANDAAVVQAIIALARSLQIRVVAEGIETTEQLKFLRDRCCDAAQGHLLGLPMQPESFSVQGFHFAAACSADHFSTSFDSLVEATGNLVRATVH